MNEQRGLKKGSDNSKIGKNRRLRWAKDDQENGVGHGMLGVMHRHAQRAVRLGGRTCSEMKVCNRHRGQEEESDDHNRYQNSAR